MPVIDGDESLVWVMVDGVPRHVSELADQPPRRRPVARCPHCDRRITLKLGRIRRHHAAHPPSSTCAVLHAETALHINTKLALASALRAHAGRGTGMRIERTCAGAGGESCERMLTTQWIDDWDSVDVETRMGVHRPDILLRRDGKPVGAIEVRASHAVPAEKAALLREAAVPWIEVAASETLIERHAWQPPEPLPVIAGLDGEWRCDVHASWQAMADARERAGPAPPEELPNEIVVLRAARVVDIYRAGGARERLIYRATDVLADGVRVAMRLQLGTRTLREIATSDDPVARRDAWRDLRAAFTEDVERRRRDASDLIDSPMRWATDDAAENIVDEALSDRVGRDPTPLASTFPRRWFYAKESGAWFLPPDMHDVRWDRPPEDAFAAHPVWRARASMVSERPAPEGSWATPIFARRPTAAMFGPRVEVRRAGPRLAIVSIAEASARAVVVVEQECDGNEILALDRELRRNAIHAVWISSPRDWDNAMRELVWVPGGRDQRGFGAVLVDGLGVYRAERFLAALRRADRRLSGPSLKRLMAARVARFTG